MTRRFRQFSFVLLAALGLVATGCGSNNTGKIDGKWKVTAMSGKTETKSKSELEEMGKQGVFLYAEFKSDGGLTFGLGTDKPEMLEMLKAFTPDKKITWDMKYKLLAGDGVEVYDVPKDMQTGGSGLFGKADRGRVAVKITGENMTLADDDTTMTMTKMK